MADLNDPKARLKQLNIVYTSMGITQLSIGIAVYFLVANNFFLARPDYNTAIFIQKIAFVFLPVSMGAGYFLYKYLVGKIDENVRLHEKVKRYFSLVLLRTAFIEAAFLFCCVAAALTNVDIFLWMAPVPFLLFLLLRPNPSDIKNDLKLSENDFIKLFES